jgi:hypothetical protein
MLVAWRSDVCNGLDGELDEERLDTIDVLQLLARVGAGAPSG